MPGILNWAIRGLERLRSRDGTDTAGLHHSQASQHMIKALEEAASPIGSFVNDWCVTGPDHSIVMKELFRAWQAYCNDQGDLKPGPFNYFGAALAEVMPGIHRQGRNPNRKYIGIALSVEGEKAFDEALEVETVKRRARDSENCKFPGKCLSMCEGAPHISHVRSEIFPTQCKLMRENA